jgi:hypothetical protein
MLFIAFLFGYSQSAAAQCTQTLSVGANVASAAAVAANGSTICLNSGNYGSVNFSGITHTALVTIRSTTGTGAQMSPQINNVDYLRFSSMTLTDVDVTGCSTHVEFVNSAFVANAPGLYFHEGSCGAQALLVDNVSFSNVNLGVNEGRLGTEGGLNGLTIKNSFFGNNGYGDGIQLGGGTNVVIGPNNVFDGISQSYCDSHGGAHCDAIQLYGAGPGLIIKQNWFKNSQTHIMAPDGSNSVTVEDNVFDGTGTSYPEPVQFGSAVNPIFRHNTVRGFSNSAVNFDSKSGSPASSGVVAENNIMQGTGYDTTGGSGCSSCTFRFNLYSTGSFARGTNNVIGTPLYIGGTGPTTWAGWQLAGGSPGKNAGSDGKDMGAGVVPATPTPAPPTNLHIVP